MLSTMSAKDNSKIRRPPNAFMFYRTHTSEKVRLMYKGNLLQSKLVSKIAGHAWHLESQESKMAFHRMADVAKQEHRLRYPDYQFDPQKVKAAAAGAQRTRTRNRKATKEAQQARKGRKAATVYGVASSTPSSSPSTPALSLSTSSLSQSESLVPSPLHTPPPTIPVASFGYGVFQDPYKQPWMATGLATLNELSPHARAEAVYRMRMLSTAASTMPMPQRGPSFPMVHEQRSAMYEQAQSGMPPTNQFAGGYIAARLPPPMMFHPGAIPMTGIHGPNVNSLGVSSAPTNHPANMNFAHSSFPGPMPQHAPAQFSYFMDSAPAQGASSSWALPTLPSGGASDPIEILDSPINTALSIPETLDVSSVSSVAPTVGAYQSQHSIGSPVPSIAGDHVLPELSDAEVVNLLQPLLGDLDPSSSMSMSAQSEPSFGFPSADVSTLDPLETLLPGHIWPPELDDWMGSVNFST